MKRIAIDIGNVLTAESPEHPKLFSSPNHLAIPNSQEAFYAIRSMLSKTSPDDCFLISRCNEENEVKIMDWLNHHDFFEFTTFRTHNVFFCRKRADKKEIAEKLKITHFVDDRWTVLKHIEEVSTLTRAFLINPKKEELSSWKSLNSQKTILCENWDQIEKEIFANQAAHTTPASAPR